MATPYNPDIHGDLEAVIPMPEFKAGPAVTEPTGQLPRGAKPYDPNVHGAIETPDNEVNENPFDQVKDLAQMIAEKESRNNYNLAANGTKLGLEGDFTTKTINEILAWQDKHVDVDGHESSAIGRYQIIRKTMRDLKSRMKLTGDELFDEGMQDRMFVELLRKRGFEKWQAGDLTDEEFANNLAKEWAALPVIGGPKHGQSYYKGVGSNEAHYGPEDVLRALGKERLPAELVEQGQQVAQTEERPKLDPIGDGLFKDADGKIVRVEKGRAYDAKTGEALFAGNLNENEDVGTILADPNVTRDQAFATIGEVLGLSKQAQQKLSDLFGFAPEAVKEVTGANLYQNTSEAVAKDDMIGAAMEVGLEILPPGLEEAARAMMVGAKSARAGVAFSDRSSGTSVYERMRMQEEKPDFDPEKFRQETGWYRDVDGSLQFEIDDSKSQWIGDQLADFKFKDPKELLRKDINGRYTNAPFKLGDILRHDELFVEYPELAQLQVGFFRNTGDHAQVGGYATQDGKLLGIAESALKDPAELRRTILHEVQHIIQSKEGWTGGNSMAGIRDRMTYLGEYDSGQNLKGETLVADAFDKHLPKKTFAVKYDSPVWNMVLQGRLMGEKKGKAFIRKEILERGIPMPRGMKLEELWTSDDITSASGMINSNAKRIEADLKGGDLDAFLKDRMKGLSILRKTEMEVQSRYYSTLGEANARNTEYRADFSPETRKAVSPETTRDVPKQRVLDREGNRIWKG